MTGEKMKCETMIFSDLRTAGGRIGGMHIDDVQRC